MANELTNSAVISKTNSGFPQYLDFDTLKSASIEYLGKLTGKVWTDYNVHDPGITILEALIYALLDLGYRTNLPAIDIFTKDPANSDEDNFFTPAQILTCNPLTITDFRKLLVDLDGVKNAWLTIADDVTPHGICQPNRDLAADKVYLNGLYHIYIEKDESFAIKEKDLTDAIKNALQTHRNLCEDFVDITFLCPFELGVCADIGLQPNAVADEVYKNILIALKNFFSPSPVFYTLQQLLDKQKSIEDIFAGRPYNFTQSHGFVDTQEFEAITLKKEIHLSDVYNVILEVEGVQTVKRLKLRTGNVTLDSKWLFELPDNYTPVFSAALSTINFTSNGIFQSVDINKGEMALQLAAATSAKLFQPGDQLDLAVPGAVYHNDLADYYSIQNDFPLVYGIGNAGLPESSSLQRIAQAEQLKAYLLFFDQLFANYLAQLRNIRSIFSFKQPSTGNTHTYFASQLSADGTLDTVPDFANLIINIADKNGVSNLGDNGTVVAWPVWKKDIDELLEKESFNSADVRMLQQQFACSSKDQCNIITSFLQSSFCEGNNQPAIYTTTSDKQIFGYIGIAGNDIVLTSALFSTPDAAAKSMQLAVGIAKLADCYKSYPNGGSFIFNLQLNIPQYGQVMQQLTESNDQYIARRNAFLDHLLSRFASQFTDYAMLSYGFSDSRQLSVEVVQNKESFLTDFPALSAERGKAFNYRQASNNVDNISGFERRFKAYTGNQNNLSHLCNFELGEYEDTYSVQLKVEGAALFKATQSYEGNEQAKAAAQSLFKSGSDASAYHIEELPAEGKWRLQLSFNNGDTAYYPSLFNDAGEADRVSMHLQQIFTNKVGADDTPVSVYKYQLQLENNGKPIRQSVAFFDSEEKAFGAAKRLLGKLSEDSNWNILDAGSKPSGEFCRNNNKKPEHLVDTKQFKIEHRNNKAGKPDKHYYELLDADNSFSIVSVREFNSQDAATVDAHKLLLFLTNINNYRVAGDKRPFRLQILEDGNLVAECLKLESKAKAEAVRDKIHAKVTAHYYKLSAVPIADKWKFTYRLGHEQQRTLLFKSNVEFNNEEEARKGAESFRADIANVNLEVIDNTYTLKSQDNNDVFLTCVEASDAITKEENTDKKLQDTQNLLAVNKKINAISQSAANEPFSESTKIDKKSSQGRFVYRLVDKDNLIAQHPVDTGENAKDVLDNLYNNFKSDPELLTICLGGDNIVAETDSKTQSTQYRYAIKCTSRIGLLPPGTILFESFQTYGSIEDAETAFTSNYVLILTYAIKDDNYGLGKYISLDKNPDIKKNKAPLVFIPQKTQDIITGANADVKETLIAAASSYPIKTVMTCSEEFNKRFPSLMCNDAGVYVYYFSAYGWDSTKPYNTLVDVRKDFTFFIMLLLEKANYFIQTDFCNKQTLYIREVLAESNRRFTTPEAAWGKAGVEKFICIAQSNDPFQAQFDKENSDFDFTVACTSDKAIHPCKYNSPAKRDEVIDKLYKSFSSFDTSKLFKIIKENGKQLIYGIDNKPIAVLLPLENAPEECERIIELLASAAIDANYKEDNGKVVLINSDDNKNIAEPYDPASGKDAWKKQLGELTYYFPIKEKQGRYCIEIRLPGFNKEKDDVPCDCKEEHLDNLNDCYVAWKGSCCFDSCHIAMREYRKIRNALGNYDNYYRRFDCECYAYGIALLREPNIVAFNPQHYSSADFVCDAIDRSKHLINSEGLRIVEHILLRPRCEEDCSCEREGFKNRTGCELTWVTEVTENGITKEKDIWLIPGLDQYSFIATIVLPAWPERFRSKENRALIETLLNREIPAHILLRILWLRPEDVCEFEGLYKDWQLWLAKATDCNREGVLCSLKEFLFEREFTCLDNCKLQCADSNVQTDCDGEMIIQKTSQAYLQLENINRLHGWKKFYCEEIEDDELRKKAKKTTAKYEELTPEEFELLQQQKTKLVNRRKTRYKKNIEAISPKNDKSIVEEAVRAADDKSVENKTVFINRIIGRQNAGAEVKALTGAEKETISKNLLWLSMDKILMDAGGVLDIDSIKKAAETLQQNGVNMQQLFKEWKAEEFSEYETADRIDAVRKAILNM